jgi:hypothetical protein
MGMFRKHKRQEDNRVFIVCETEEDIRKLWDWTYNNGYTTAYRDLSEFLEEFEKYCDRPCMKWNEDTQELEDVDVEDVFKYIQPPMYCIDPRIYEVLIVLDSPYVGDEASKNAREYQRQHALIASDIDFDFLNVRR